MCKEMRNISIFMLYNIFLGSTNAFCSSQRTPFHRYDDEEGSRCVASRFVSVIITKSSQAAMSVMYIVTTSKQQKSPSAEGQGLVL